MEEKNHFVHGVAYGKLYLAGEYAILEDYASALITSVPKKITVFVEKVMKLLSSIRLIKLKLDF